MTVYALGASVSGRRCKGNLWGLHQLPRVLFDSQTGTHCRPDGPWPRGWRDQLDYGDVHWCGSCGLPFVWGPLPRQLPSPLHYGWHPRDSRWRTWRNSRRDLKARF